MSRSAAVFLVLGCLGGASCQHALPRFSDAPLGPGDYEGAFEHGEHTRTFRVHVPRSYDGGRPLPLVLAFHGAGGNVSNNEKLMGWIPKADAEGFLVVSPQGLGTSIGPARLGVWNAGTCCGYAKSHQIDDVGFVRKLIDEVSARLRVDPARVFATGFSNGAAMTHRLACELSDRIAAVAPVSGLLLNFEMGEGEPLFECRPPRAVPILEIHGAKDRVALYGGGQSTCLFGSPVMPSVERTIAGWAARNSCGPASTESWTPPGASCEWFDGCRADTVLCTVDHLGHAWPGGKRVPFPCMAPWSDAIDATALIWTFFSAHPMPAP